MYSRRVDFLTANKKSFMKLHFKPAYLKIKSLLKGPFEGIKALKDKFLSDNKAGQGLTI